MGDLVPEQDGTVIRDFAKRTLHNLRFIEEQHAGFERGESRTDAYEVTQFINSMLGLLIFPREQFWEHIRPIPFEDIPGCPFHPHPGVPDLQQLVRVIRNSFAHFNLELGSWFGRMHTIELHNVNRGGRVTWRDQVELTELRRFIEWFAEGIIDSSLLDMQIETIKVA